MNVEITYSTPCECTLHTVDGESWTYNHRFTVLGEAILWARKQIDESRVFDVENINITDMNTGELLAVCTPDTIGGPTAVEDDWDEKEWEAEWGFNEDEGYDPYLGCYTDDC